MSINTTRTCQSTESTPETMSTRHDQRPISASTTGVLDALGRVPGLRRAWPGRTDEVIVECHDDQDRLRAGILAGDGGVRLLPYATDPRLPALSPRLPGELVVHRAGRRAVLLGDDRVRKTTRPGRARPSQGALEAYRAFSAVGLRIPRIYGTGEAYIDLERLPGHSLAELGDEGLAGWQYLAGVWGDLRPPEADLAVHGPLQEAEVLRGWFERAHRYGVLEGLVESPDALTRAVEAACARLAEEPGPMTLCHRDLHGGQLLWTGEELSLIDLDTPCVAEAALDVANLIAHAELMALQGRLSRQGADALEPVLESLAASVPTGAERLSVYHQASALRVLFVHAFRPPARTWLPQWAHLCLTAPSSSFLFDTRSSSCV